MQPCPPSPILARHVIHERRSPIGSIATADGSGEQHEAGKTSAVDQVNFIVAGSKWCNVRGYRVPFSGLSSFAALAPRGRRRPIDSLTLDSDHRVGS
jgi:hypothetical protein